MRFDTRPIPYMLEQAHKSQCNNVPTLIFINVVQEENPPPPHHSNQQPLWAFFNVVKYEKYWYQTK